MKDFLRANPLSPQPLFETFLIIWVEEGGITPNRKIVLEESEVSAAVNYAK